MQNHLEKIFSLLRKFDFEMQLSVIRKLYEKLQTFKPERP